MMNDLADSVIAFIYIALLFALGAALYEHTRVHNKEERPRNCVEILIEKDLDSAMFEYQGQEFYCVRREEM